MTPSAQPFFAASNRIIVNTFGVPVTYTTQAGQAFTIQGVFDRFDRADPRPESPYSNLFCIVADFPTPAAGMPPIPSRGDSINLGDGVKRIIFEINEDNQGGADLRISTVK